MRIVVRLVVGAVLTVLFLAPSRADERNASTMTAPEILDRMAKIYSGCKSYRDSGVVTVVFLDGNGSRTVEKPFRTAFVRPERFRFEFTAKQGEREQRYIVWKKGKEVQTWWDVRPGIEKPDSLSLALAGATGVSNGAAHHIPALLLPKDVDGRRLTDMTEIKRGEDAIIDKINCFRIEGKFAVASMVVWIDQRTFLIRRMESKDNLDSVKVVQTAKYAPVIDEQVPDAALEFNAPGRT